MNLRTLAFILLTPLLADTVARAQWQTQTIEVLPGWNGVYLHVGTPHDTFANLLAGTPVSEVWLWMPDLTSLQFVTSPAQPLDSDTRWLSWKREVPIDATLNTFLGNAAYLIRMDDPLPGGAPSYTLQIKGKPAPPVYQWSSDGVNLLGFSTVDTNAPNLEDFFTPAPSLLANGEIYQYIGGDISSNPVRVFALRTTDVTRGKAFWIRDETQFNRYFGPFDLRLQDHTGIDFGNLVSTSSFRLTNMTPDALTVTLEMVSSEAPPSGEMAIAGDPEILVEDELDLATLTRPFSRLSDGAYQWELTAAGEEGSEIQVTIGLDRSAMGGSVGDLFAGVLRFTDSVGTLKVDVPVSAEQGSLAGLWVGEANVTQVRHDLSFYDRSGEEAELTGTDVSFGGVARPYSLRLIVHVDAAGNAELLQRVYYGFDDNIDELVATQENLLSPDYLSISRRISAPHFPWQEGNPAWPMTGGTFSLGQTINTTVTVGHSDQRSNPFLHTYHPDHDNRTATFDATLAPGKESYQIDRDISLAFEALADSFSALTLNGRVMAGTYGETITLSGTGNNQKEYAVQGTFSLTRLSTIDDLRTPTN